MTCSLSSSPWSPSLSLFSNTFTSANSSITHHQHKLLLPLINLPTPFINPPSKVYLYPEQFSFKLTHTNIKTNIKSQSFSTSQTTALTFHEAKDGFEERDPQSKVERFAEKITEIPVQERAKFVTNVIEDHVGSKTIAYFNDLIMGLVRVQELDLALKVFDEMPLHGLTPDWWTYSIIIRCYCKKNEPNEGKRLLDCMIENGFRPNVVTFTILVNSFCSRGKVQRALEVLEMMGKFGCKPNIQTFNCVLKGLCFVGRIEEAYEVLMGLKKGANLEGSNKPDIYSYTAVMDGLCKVGRTDEAMELLNEAIGVGLSPNMITYNTLFNGYCKEGKPRKGIWLLKVMKERGCEPDYISFSTLLHGLLKWRKIMAALWVYKEMLEGGFKVDERMMNTLLRALCRKSWQEEGLFETVYEVFDLMKSWEYDIYPDTYCLVIQTYCVGKEVDKALFNLYGMVEAGHFPRMVTINRIIRGLCEQGKISEALTVLVLVCEASRIPSKISYNILIDEFNRQGQLLGASGVYGAALKLGVIPHRKPLYVL